MQQKIFTSNASYLYKRNKKIKKIQIHNMFRQENKRTPLENILKEDLRDVKRRREQETKQNGSEGKRGVSWSYQIRCHRKAKTPLIKERGFLYNTNLGSPKVPNSHSTTYPHLLLLLLCIHENVGVRVRNVFYL